MKLLCLLEDPDGPSARLRVRAWEPHLRAAGIASTLERVAPAGPRRWRQLAGARAFDAVLLQRRLLLPWESALLRRCARRVLFDVDDALWRRDHPEGRASANGREWESRARAWKFRGVVRACDVVLVGSEELAQEVHRFGVRACVLPTPAAIVPVSRAPAEQPTLLWIGQESTTRYLQSLAAVIAALRARLPTLEVLLLGASASASTIPGAIVRAWSHEEEERALARAWVGLAPLPEDPWTRGKCGARLLTYLANGLPAVAAPTGAQRELASEIGGTLLASGEHAWEDALRRLLADPDLRRQLALGLSERANRVRGPESLFPRLLRALQPQAQERNVAGAGRVR